MKIEHALKLAEQGFRVFPLVAGTKVPPKGFAWKDEATTDESRIREWWEHDPEFNVGVATGNGSIVVDADTKDGRPGLASLEMLDMLGLPTSFRVDTPSGGKHVYLKVELTHANRVDSIPDYPGIDLRGENGYVVGPGSTIDGREYVAKGGAIEPAGEWVETTLKAAAATHRLSATREPTVELDLPDNIDLAIRYLTDRAPEATEHAGGDQTTYSVAARCRGYGLSADMTFEIMAEHWNEQKAFPAWNPDELKAKIDNAYRYATGAWGGETAAGEFSDMDTADIDIGVSPFAKDSPAPGKKSGKILKVLDYAAMQAMPEPEWLVDGLIGRYGAALLYGKSNAFKSFLAVDVGLHVATGRTWHGRKVQQMNVLFVATEGAVGVGRQRVPGWYDHYAIASPERAGAFLYPQEIAIDVKENVDLLTDTIRYHKIGLVVLDIFGGTMNGTEVEDTTARAWVRSVQRIIRETGATVLTVAHTGWQDTTRARMHTHFWGSFDTRLIVEGDKDKLTSVMKVERHKDADSRGEFGFRLEPSHNTLIPVLDEKVSAKPGSGLSMPLQVGLAALEKATADDHGKVMSGDTNFPQITPVVHIDTWRAYCYDMGISSSTKDAARRQAFNRAMNELIARGLLKRYSDHVWSAVDSE